MKFWFDDLENDLIQIRVDERGNRGRDIESKILVLVLTLERLAQSETLRNQRCKPPSSYGILLGINRHAGKQSASAPIERP